MAGKLIQVATNTVTSATPSVTLTGINTDDVYMVTLNNVQGDTDIKNLQVQVTASGTAQTTANYDFAKKTLRANTTFSNNFNTNQTLVMVNSQLSLGTATGESMHGILYLYNFNNASEYSFASEELVFMDYSATRTMGGQGGWVYTVAEAHDGVHFTFSGGNIASGTLTLYRVI